MAPVLPSSPEPLGSPSATTQNGKQPVCEPEIEGHVAVLPEKEKKPSAIPADLSDDDSSDSEASSDGGAPLGGDAAGPPKLALAGLLKQQKGEHDTDGRIKLHRPAPAFSSGIPRSIGENLTPQASATNTDSDDTGDADIKFKPYQRAGAPSPPDNSIPSSGGAFDRRPQDWFESHNSRFFPPFPPSRAGIAAGTGVGRSLAYDPAAILGFQDEDDEDKVRPPPTPTPESLRLRPRGGPLTFVGDEVVDLPKLRAFLEKEFGFKNWSIRYQLNGYGVIAPRHLSLDEIMAVLREDVKVKFSGYGTSTAR